MWRHQPERTMPSAATLKMKEPGDYHDPVSFRYEMRTNWGLVAQELTVDVKIDVAKDEYIPAIGLSLWNATIATAISNSVYLDLMWYVRWRRSPLALPWPPSLLARGRQSGLPAGKAHTAVVLQHTGHPDNYAARGIYLPNTPLSWQSEGMLTERGWDSLLTWAQGLKMGLPDGDGDADLRHLVMYNGAVTPSLENLGGVGFREVTHLKVMQFTDKAPDFTYGLWP